MRWPRIGEPFLAAKECREHKDFAEGKATKITKIQRREKDSSVPLSVFSAFFCG
jgi:hypothetical protein